MEEMPKNYDPSTNEPAILQKWLDGGYYKRREGVGDCTVTIPPPNVTGKLHMGHATDDSIQDAIIRMARMRGKSTRWVLGTDHAGIATQTKVDKKLKSEGISRLEIGRDKFVDACWDWTHEYGGIIVEQIKRMGCSVDFDNERFTMDEDYAQAVRKVFCDWYHDGLIYRGKRIVNWCPNCTTAISDDEAEYKDEKGHLWHLRYPLTEPVNGQDYIVVATTRPETMLGDTGVAVSPKDPEKAAFVGKTVKLPIVDREIPIFEDWHVDANFGSGFVKVTPAHDPNDYAMGQAHDLPQINIFDEHAVVVEGYGEFTGMNRDECREAVIKWFEEHDLLDHVEDLDHSVMHCYRCDSALEPWLSEQCSWPSTSSKGRRSTPSTPARSPSTPRAGRRPTPPGWRTSRTGASHASCGGATASPCSTARIAAGRTPLPRTPTCAPSAAASRASGRERAGHLVQLAAVDLRHAGLAAKAGAARRDITPRRRCHRARHHRAVGRPHGHELALLPGRGAV